MPSIEDIIEDYNSWKWEKPTNIDTLSDSKKKKWNQGYNPNWKRMYPWIEEVKMEGKVVGILCSLCREDKNFNSQDGYTQRKRNNGTFVTKPLAKFGSFIEQAR